MIWKKLLIIGVLLFIVAIGLGDYILTINYKVVTLSPSQSTTISQADVLAKQPLSAQSPLGVIVEGTATFTVYQGPQTLVNNSTKTTTIIIVQNNTLLNIDYSLIIVSFTVILLSSLGLLYTYVIKKSKAN